MCNTFLNPKTCGFGKVAAIYAAKTARELKRGESEGKNKFGARILQEQYTTFKEIFHQRDDFSMEFKDFNKKYSALQEAINKWSPRKNQDKEEYLKQFSIDNWMQLSDAKKREHTLFVCKGCHQNFVKAQ
jgi:predicted transcriptional regulator